MKMMATMKTITRVKIKIEDENENEEKNALVKIFSSLDKSFTF